MLVKKDSFHSLCYQLLRSRLFLFGVILLNISYFTFFYNTPFNTKVAKESYNQPYYQSGNVQKSEYAVFPLNIAYRAKISIADEPSKTSNKEDIKVLNRPTVLNEDEQKTSQSNTDDDKSVEAGGLASGSKQKVEIKQDLMETREQEASNDQELGTGEAEGKTEHSENENDAAVEIVEVEAPSNPAPISSTRGPPKEPEPKLILAWTTLHKTKPLWSIRPWSFRKCNYSNCAVSGNRDDLDKADLLLFRVRQLKKNLTAEPIRPYVQPLDFSDLPSHHPEGQMWIDVNQESPIFTHSDDEIAALNGKFNLVSNYLLDSDLSLSYIPLVTKKTPPSPPINYAEGKTKMALWFVSHCEAGSGRDEYVAELQKHNITVDVFGKCTGMSDGCSAHNYTCYEEVRRKYRFYLAFENSICSEYITEKFWNTLSSTAYNIPIGLGATLEEYNKFSPSNSYLHTRNFTGVAALADYMKKIASNDALFNSYHAWRENNAIQPQTNSETLHCYICRAANEKKGGSPKYKDYSSYWSRKKFCEMDPEPLGPNEGFENSSV